MTALGGLDGLGPVAATTPRASRRPAVDASLVDALSGPDGTSDPAPWPVDTGGLTTVGDVFPDALNVDLTSGSPAVDRPTWSRPDPQTTSPGAAAPRPDPRTVAPAAAVRLTQNVRPQNVRPTQNTRAPQPQRAAQNAWATSGSGRPGQNAPRQAPPAARRTSAPAPTAPARPAYGSGSTGWSPGGTQSARDLMRMAREAGGLGLAATPFRRSGEQRAVAHQPMRSSTPQTVQQAGAAAQRSQWGSQQARSQWGSPHPRRSPDRRTRRRSNGSAVFTVFVLAVVILFASGGAQAIIHLLTTLFGR